MHHEFTEDPLTNIGVAELLAISAEHASISGCSTSG
jgi:hypothetical protein